MCKMSGRAWKCKFDVEGQRKQMVVSLIFLSQNCFSVSKDGDSALTYASEEANLHVMQYLADKLKKVEDSLSIDVEILEGEMLHMVGTMEMLLRR